jgi:hypothetical protein
MPFPTYNNWQWWLVKNEALRQRDNFNFLIVNFPFICSNIPAAYNYGLYISPLIWCSRACGSYLNFLDEWLLLTRKMLNQVLVVARLSHQFESFTLAIMIWVGNICTCVTDDHIHVFLSFIEVTISYSPLWWFISGFCTRVSWKRVSRLFCLVFWGGFYHCLSFVLFPLAIVFSVKSIVHSQTLPIRTSD